MRKMATIWQAKTHNTVLWLNQSCEGSEVGSGTRVWLHVDSPHVRVQVESSKGALLRKSLKLVNVLVTTVVTRAWETFRVLVRQDRTVGFHRGQRSQVFRRNKLKASELTIRLIVDDFLYLWVGLSEGLVQDAVLPAR